MASASLQAFSLFCGSLGKAREDTIDLRFNLLALGHDAGQPRRKPRKLRPHHASQFRHVVERVLDRDQFRERSAMRSSISSARASRTRLSAADLADRRSSSLR
jgi:hypothetical protein